MVPPLRILICAFHTMLFKIIGTCSRCCGVTLILPAGPRSSFLQLPRVLADDDFHQSPFPGIALTKTAILLKVMPPPCFLGAVCNPPWICGYKYPSRCPQNGQIRPEILEGLARTLLKLQTSSATLSAKSHFLQSLSLSFPLIVDAKSTLNKFTLCQSPFQSVPHLSNQSWV